MAALSFISSKSLFLPLCNVLLTCYRSMLFHMQLKAILFLLQTTVGKRPQRALNFRYVTMGLINQVAKIPRSVSAQTVRHTVYPCVCVCVNKINKYIFSFFLSFRFYAHSMSICMCFTCVFMCVYYI